MFLALAGCSAPAVVPVGNAAAPGAGLPPLYARLFEPGRWTFAGEWTATFSTRRQVANGPVECRIDDPRPIGHGWAAEIGCLGLQNTDLIYGTYVGNERGLWRVEHGDVTKLPEHEMLIAATPEPVDRVGDAASTSERWFAMPHGDHWCFGHTTWDAAEHGWMLCVAEGRGIVGGRGYSDAGKGLGTSGGPRHDSYFGDAPRE